MLEEFDVEEQPSSVLEEKFPNLTVIHSAVKSLHTQSHVSICFVSCNRNCLIAKVILYYILCCAYKE